MTRIRTKLCGMMTPGDARAAAEAGADSIGMILHADAKRLISLDTARDIVAALPPYVTAVGVFVDAVPALVQHVAAQLRLSTVQFHGNETIDDLAAVAPLKVIKAVKVDRATIRHVLDEWRDLRRARRADNLAALLLESPVKGAAGGTGVANDFGLIRELQFEGHFDGLPPIVVSGGLGPDNVEGVVRLLRPYAVDVSSGIESSFGVKSVEKMRAFVRNVQTDAAST